MTEAGVGVRWQSLYKSELIGLWRQFDKVVIKDSLSPFFLWADHNNPQSELARQHLKRIQRLGCSSYIHGTLPMRRQYLPWWLGGSVTFNPLTKTHITKSQQPAYPQDVETRLRDFKRIVQHNTCLAAEFSLGIDVVSQLFDGSGSYRRFGTALLRDSFLWAKDSIGAAFASLYLNESLGVSRPRWDSILDKIDATDLAGRMTGVSLQVHHPVGKNDELNSQLALCRYVCQSLKDRGLEVNFAEMQFWLPHYMEETSKTESEWSYWHSAFHSLAQEYDSPSYIVWGLRDDGTAQLPLGGHGQNAFNYASQPKPFIKEIINT